MCARLDDHLDACSMNRSSEHRLSSADLDQVFSVTSRDNSGDLPLHCCNSLASLHDYPPKASGKP